jgi:hypothetical protein
MQVIRDYLLQDVVDTTPAVIRSLNPGVWASDDDVPVYMYTSLCTLWTGVSGDVVSFGLLISANSGRGDVTTSTISISPLIQESMEATEGPEHIDYIGGENTKIFITFLLPRSVPEGKWGKIQNAELRIRLLLDANIRGACRKPVSIPISGDTSIDPEGGFLLTWQAFANDPNESYLVAEYQASYIRAFGRAVIP